MQLTVSDKNLRLVMSRFRASQGANLRFVLSPSGLDVAANAEGYLTLARWFMIMAHPEMEDHADGEWLNAAYHLGDVMDVESGGPVVTLEAIWKGERRSLGANDVRLYRSESVNRLELGP